MYIGNNNLLKSFVLIILILTLVTLLCGSEFFKSFFFLLNFVRKLNRLFRVCVLTEPINVENIPEIESNIVNGGYKDLNHVEDEHLDLNEGSGDSLVNSRSFASSCKNDLNVEGSGCDLEPIVIIENDFETEYSEKMTFMEYDFDGSGGSSLPIVQLEPIQKISEKIHLYVNEADVTLKEQELSEKKINVKINQSLADQKQNVESNEIFEVTYYKRHEFSDGDEKNPNEESDLDLSTESMERNYDNQKFIEENRKNFIGDSFKILTNNKSNDRFETKYTERKMNTESSLKLTFPENEVLGTDNNNTTENKFTTVLPSVTREQIYDVTYHRPIQSEEIQSREPTSELPTDLNLTSSSDESNSTVFDSKILETISNVTFHEIAHNDSSQIHNDFLTHTTLAPPEVLPAPSMDEIEHTTVHSFTNTDSHETKQSIHHTEFDTTPAPPIIKDEIFEPTYRPPIFESINKPKRKKSSKKQRKTKKHHTTTTTIDPFSETEENDSVFIPIYHPPQDSNEILEYDMEIVNQNFDVEFNNDTTLGPS